MGKELDRINQKIEKINHQMQLINDECTTKIAEIAGGSSSRILSYTKEEELNKTIDEHTKKLSKLIVELEELELLRQEYIKSEK